MSDPLRPESVNLEAWDDSDTPIVRDEPPTPKAPRRGRPRRHPDAWHILPLRTQVDHSTHGLWHGSRLVAHGTEEHVRDLLARLLAAMDEEGEEQP